MSTSDAVSSVKCPRCKVYATSLDPPTVQITGLVSGYRSRHCAVCEWQQWECMPHAEWLAYQDAEDARRKEKRRAMTTPLETAIAKLRRIGNGAQCHIDSKLPTPEEAAALLAEREHMRAILIAMMDNDPREPAADGGITLLDVWRKEAAGLVGVRP